MTVKEIQSNRLSTANQLSAKFNAVVILKGAGSVIGSPDGSLRINTSGNPGLATGGTGDVLAGLCGALLAQGFDCFHAAQLATWVHGNAADILVSKGVGPIGICASELPVEIRAGLNSLVNSHRNQV
jgi:NAD(P)H-hydrate repair Nnr-like enzyme with NAD(P)H-hydrate dehydratase domain